MPTLKLFNILEQCHVLEKTFGNRETMVQILTKTITWPQPNDHTSLELSFLIDKMWTLTSPLSGEGCEMLLTVLTTQGYLNKLTHKRLEHDTLTKLTTV